MTTRPQRPETSLEWSEIRRWRGYRASTFYAVTEAGEVLAESGSFRWSKAGPPPDTPAIRAEFDTVVAAVSAAGWTISEEATDAWCEARFHRPAAAPAEPAPAVVAPPEPPPAAEASPAPQAPPPRAERPAPPAVTPPASHVPAAPETRLPPAPGRRGRTRTLAVAGVTAAVLAAAAAAALPSTLRRTASSHGPAAGPPTHHAAQPHARRGTSGTPTARRQPTAEPKHSQPTAPAPGRRLVDLRIAAGDRPSWIEIRRRSSTGPMLYSGTLAAGQQLHFRGARLWARFGAAGNLVITDNGRRVELSGTQEKVFVP